VLINPGNKAAISGLALIALSLTGSTRNAASSPISVTHSASPALTGQMQEAQKLFRAGQFGQAREHFLTTAARAEAEGNTHTAAIAWNGAGAASGVTMQSRQALEDFLRARRLAESSGDADALARTLNNLASLYQTMGRQEGALSMAREGLAVRHGAIDPAVARALRYEEAEALASLGKFNEAEPLYLSTAADMENSGDLANAARVLGAFGNECLKTGDRLDMADAALSKALAMVRIHRLNNGANILRGLARLRQRQGDARSAAALFQAALDAPPGATPRWMILADRGDFLLSEHHLDGALRDFREARRLAARARADVVPADQDRVALEGGLSRVAAGLIEAGNRQALAASYTLLLEETFAAAEQDRLWSLRALIPEPNDWRTRLPARYWEVLARYQNAERSNLGARGAGRAGDTTELQQQLEQMEAQAAGSGVGREAGEEREASGLTLQRIRARLDAESVLFSFHTGKAGGWVWAADRKRVSAYQIADAGALHSEAAALTQALQRGDASRARALGQQIYRSLFGGAAKSYLEHRRWLLELDGPLFDVPFAALIAEGSGGGQADYLVNRAALETIPSALMLEPRKPFRRGEFLGVGDPVYNSADARYGTGGAKPEMALPRLPATAPELTACAREWGAGARLLTGLEAGAAQVGAALGSNPAVIHFATHVVAGPGEHASGLIALSLSRDGTLGLMGPTEIVARRVSAQLVVLNGCHSAQGEALPGAGLMGLTRAWIGAGAKAVLATRWDIPDNAGQALAVAFYRALRSDPGGGPARALQRAQVALQQDARWTPAVWAAYFLLATQ